MPQQNVLIDFTKWLLKWIVVWVVGLIALAGAAIGAIYGWQWWSQDRHVAAIEIVVFGLHTAGVDEKAKWASTCPATHPTFVGIVNRSSRTITNLTAMISATKRGYSTNLIKDGYVKSDRVVKPGEGWGSCFKFFENMFDGADLDFRGEVWGATFAP